MPRTFSPATAEQVVLVTEACVASKGQATADFIARFCDLPEPSVHVTLSLAVDLGLLEAKGDGFVVATPLARFAALPDQNARAAAIRILLDDYEPFVTFIMRLQVATPSDAAQQTKVLLDLDAHREDIKDTLISLGTYAQALVSGGGGGYEPSDLESDTMASTLLAAIGDLASAEATVRSLVHHEAAEWASTTEVLQPLARALLVANSDPLTAVVNGGNAVDSYLQAVATDRGVALTSTGINGHLDQLRNDAGLPKKLQHYGKYLGHLRNAADHGVDQDVGASWTITQETGEVYPLTACAFIRSVESWRREVDFLL